MAKVILEAGDNYVAASAATIFGSTGSETVKILDGVTVTTDASVERVEFSRASSEYTYQATNTGVQVRYNGGIVANLVTGEKVAFTDGSASIASNFDATTGTATFTLGGKNVPTTATSGTVLAPAISNATGEASTLSPSTASSNSTYSIAASAGPVTEGNAVTFTVTASSASATATTLSYQISGVAVGNSVNAASSADFASVIGSVTLPANATTATFTVVPNNDGVVEGFEGFKISLLDSSFNTVATSNAVVIADGALPGQTINLTVGIDSPTTTDGPDTIIGQLGQLTTLQASDQIYANNGNDTLRVVTDGAVAQAVSGFQLVSVEKVEVQSAAVGGTTLGLSGADASLATVRSTNSSSNVTFNDVSKLVSAEIVNNTNASSLTINYGATVIAGATSQDLAVNTVNGAFNAAGVETVNVNATGTNTLTFGTAPTTINAAGTGSLALGTLTSTTTTLNAAQNSGGVNAILGAATATVTGGSGADQLNVSAVTGNVVLNAGGGNDTITATTNLTTTDTISGGDGTDTLVVTTASAANLDGVTSVEILKASGTLTTVTLDSKAQTAGVNTVSADGANSLSVTTATTGYTNALTVNLGTGADTVTNTGNVTLTVNAAESAVTIADALTGGTGSDTLVITADAGNLNLGNVQGFETVTVLPNATTAAEDVSVTIGNNTIASGKTLKIDATALVDTGATLTVDATANQSDEVVSVLGGAGNDTITAGSGNDVIDTGLGEDSINSGAGNDSISSGAGNDTINVAGNLTADDTIDGGDGIDTLVVTSVTSAALAHVSNIEKLQFSSSATLSSNLSFTNFDLSAITGGQTLTLGAGYTNATTVTLGTGDSVIDTAANAPLTINASVTVLNGNPIITGGTGTDILNVSGGTVTNLDLNNYLTSTPYLTLVNITAVDRINLVDVGDDATGASAAGSDYRVELGNNYGTPVTVDASQLDAGTIATNGSLNADWENAYINGGSLTVSLTAIGGAGQDTITGGAGNDSLSGGAGNDTITVGLGANTANGGDGDDSITATSVGNNMLLGGAGNDTFTLTGGSTILTGEDSIDGGTGVNTLVVDAGIINLDLLNVFNIQTLSLATAGTTTLGTNANLAGINKVVGTSGNDVVNASSLTGGVTFATESGNDNLTSGAGNDTFIFSGSNLDANDIITAGTGTDVIQLNNANAGVGAPVTATLDTVAGVEKIVVNDGSLATDTAGDVTINLNANFQAVNNVTIIDGSALDLGEVLTVDAHFNLADDATTTTVNEAEAVSVIGGDGADSLLGGAANDTIIGNSGSDSIDGGNGNDSLSGGEGRDYILGGAGNDVINGDNGNDVIIGGTGLDILTGGAGNDIFVYNAVADSTGANADTITDFVSGTDRVFVNTGLITNHSTNTIAVFKGNASNFEAAQALLVVGESGSVYNQATHTLWVDANSDGTLNANDIQISLSNVTTLAASDIYSGATSPTVTGISTWGGTVAQYNTAASTLETDDTVTIVDTSANINANLAALLADSKVDLINAAATTTGAAGSVSQASNDTTPVVLTQAQALVAANMAKFTDSTDVITVSDVTIDTQAEVVALAAISGVDNIDLTTSGAVTLDWTTYNTNAAKLGTNGAITVSDTSTNLNAHLSALLGDTKVDNIDSTDNSIALVINTTDESSTTKMAKLQSGDTITVSDSSANINANSGTTLANLFADSKVDNIDSSDNNIALTITAAQERVAANMAKLQSDDTITVSDSSANISANLTALFADTKVDNIDENTSTAFNVNVAQASVQSNRDKLQSGDTIIVNDTSANIGASLTTLNDNTANSAYDKIDSFNLTDNAITLTESQYSGLNKAFASDDVVTVTGGIGASTLNAAKAGTLILKYTSGDQASIVTFADANNATALAANDTFTLSNPDVISNFTLGTDSIDLKAFGLSGLAQVTDFTTNYTVLRDDSYYIVRGNLAGSTFTNDPTTGSSSLVLFDSNTGAGNTAINMVGVVISGVIVTSTDLLLS